MTGTTRRAVATRASTRRWQSAAAVSAVGALALAGCGSSSKGASAPAAPASAASSGAAAASPGGGASTSTSAPSSGAASSSAAPTQPSQQQTPELVVLQSAGKTTGARTARVTLTESVAAAGQKITLTGSGTEDFAGKSADLTFQAAGQSLETRIVGGAVYVKLPAAAAGSVGGGKPWLKATAAGGGSLPGLSGSGQSGDPATALALLTSVSTNVTTVGKGSVQATPTTRYRLTVDVVKAAAKQGAQSACVLQQERKLLKSSLIPVTVDVDAQGRVRQLSLRLDIAGATTGTGSVAVTEQFSDFGTPVSVTAPPASQVSTQPLPGTSATATCSSSKAG